MKRFVLSVLMFFALFGAAQEANACISKEVIMLINGCSYRVCVCYDCSPVGLLDGNVKMNWFEPTDPNCNPGLSLFDIVQYIQNVISSPEFFYTNLCLDPSWGIPPCPAQTDEIEIRKPLCWKIRLVEVGWKNKYRYINCDDEVYCAMRYRWCRDTETGKTTRITTYGPTPFGTPSCSLEAYEVDPLTLQNVGDETQCFILHNECWPEY